jgi:hypothetical protein
MRLASAHGLSERDGHGLAGFIEAEGCFRITPNNRGTTWSCSFSLAQRDDEIDLLRDLQRVTGIGRLSRRAGQGNSHPQVTWSVASKRECSELGALLRRFPLRGRKRIEAAIWCTAVEFWASEAYSRRDPCVDERLRAFRAAIRGARRYDNWAAVPPALIDRDDETFRAYFGGFFSGDGHLQLRRTSALATIHLRADDVSLLRGFADAFGVGQVDELVSWGRNPTAVWRVARRQELRRLSSLLADSQLRGRKRRELEAWSIGAEELCRATESGRRPDAGTMADAIEMLRAARAYRPPENARSEADPSDGRAAYVEVLRRWARSTPGTLTCSAYARDRRSHDGWPQRETISRAFGGWGNALRAAGIESDSIPPRSRAVMGQRAARPARNRPAIE